MSMCREDEVYSIGLCKILPLIQAMFHLEKSGKLWWWQDDFDDRPQIWSDAMMPFYALVTSCHLICRQSMMTLWSILRTMTPQGPLPLHTVFARVRWRVSSKSIKLETYRFSLGNVPSFRSGPFPAFGSLITTFGAQCSNRWLHGSPLRLQIPWYDDGLHSSYHLLTTAHIYMYYLSIYIITSYLLSTIIYLYVFTYLLVYLQSGRWPPMLEMLERQLRGWEVRGDELPICSGLAKAVLQRNAEGPPSRNLHQWDLQSSNLIEIWLQLANLG